jgi:hypothetical protein
MLFAKLRIFDALVSQDKSTSGNHYFMPYFQNRPVSRELLVK